MKKALTILFFLLVLAGCSSADLYRLNYPNDPEMQERMEQQYGNSFFWKD